MLGYTLAAAALLACFVLATSVHGLVFVLGTLIGLFINGCVAGPYALTPAIHPPGMRATGVGRGIGVGRGGAILSPLVASWLLDAGWEPGQLFLLVSVVLMLGALAVRALRITQVPPGSSREAPTVPIG